MSTIIDSINRLGALVDEPVVRAPDYIDGFARPLDLRAFTAQEREWIAEGEREMKAEEAARGVA